MRVTRERLIRRISWLGVPACVFAITAPAPALGASSLHLKPGANALSFCVYGFATGPEEEEGVLTYRNRPLRFYRTTSDVWNGYRAWFRLPLPDGRVAKATVASALPTGAGTYRVRRVKNIGEVAVTYRDLCVFETAPVT
jgi:hypothetical protein